MADERKFALRYRNRAGSLIQVVDDPDIEVEEICPTCLKGGIIGLLHDESVQHKGSDSFRPWKPSVEWLRKAADDMEAKLNGR